MVRGVVSIPEPATLRRNSFARACYGVAQARLENGHQSEFIDRRDVDAWTIACRADALAGATTDANYAALMQDSFGQFLQTTAPFGAAARLFELAIRADLRGIDEIHFPVRSSAPTTPSFILENGAIPIKNPTFSTVSLGPARKLAHIVVWSRELSRRSDAARIFALLLRENIAGELDAALFDAVAASTSRPAGLLNGLTPITSVAGGSSSESMQEDLAALGSAVSAGGSGNVLFVVSPARFARLRLFSAALVDGIDVVASAAIPNDRVVAVDAASIIIAMGEIEIVQSENATLHMNDAAIELVSASAVVADPTRSLYQSASVSARIIIEVDWKPRRTGAVAYIDSIVGW